MRAQRGERGDLKREGRPGKSGPHSERSDGANTTAPTSARAPRPWVARLAERFVTSRDWGTLAGLDDDEVQAVLDVAAEQRERRR